MVVQKGSFKYAIKWFLLTACATLLLLPCQPSAQAPAPPKADGAVACVPITPSAAVEGLPNFARVSETLYRGAQPTREGFAELKKMGVKTVICLRANHSDRALLKGLGLNYVEIPLDTWKHTDSDVASFLSVVGDASLQPVFVHCQHGADRTGLMVSCYRMAVQGCPREAVLKELESFGFHGVWANIRRYLKKVDPAKLVELSKKAKRPAVEIIP